MTNDRIRNVYTFKHVTGEQFYNRSLRDQQALIMVELDGKFQIFFQSDLSDDGQTVDTDHLNTDELKHNMITAMIDVYLNNPNLRITPNTEATC